jgi:hypothetical protein
MSEPFQTDSERTNEAVRRIAELTGIALDPERAAFAADFLREVREAADLLLELDLDGVAPDAVYDPRWPETVE